MAFSRQSSDKQKKYFWRAADYGNGLGLWYYVTADGPGAVEVSGYFNDAAGELQVGDIIMSWQVGAVSDTRTVSADIAAGLTDVSRHIVVVNDGSTVDVTPELSALSVEYSLP